MGGTHVSCTKAWILARALICRLQWLRENRYNRISIEVWSEQQPSVCEEGTGELHGAQRQKNRAEPSSQVR